MTSEQNIINPSENLSVRLLTEITKVFGAEMASIFSAKITDEELMARAQKAWTDISKDPSTHYYNSKNNSDIDKLVQQTLLERYKAEILKILETENAKVIIHDEAVQILEDIRYRTREKIIESVSTTLALMYGYGGRDLKAVVEDAVAKEIRSHNR